MTPWTDPINLTRAWCLFEIFTTMNSGVKIDFALPKSQKEAFVNYMTHNYDKSKGIFEKINRIDIRKADAFKQVYIYLSIL